MRHLPADVKGTGKKRPFVEEGTVAECLSRRRSNFYREEEYGPAVFVGGRGKKSFGGWGAKGLR